MANTAKKTAATGAKKKTTRKSTAKKTTAKKATPKKVKVEKMSPETEESTMTDFKEKAKDKARSVATDGKDKTSDAIGNLSKMIEDSAETLDDNVGEKYGDYARSAADAVSSFADKLNDKEVDEMVEDARDFVRKSPAVAIGAAAVVGFLISRLIKSGSDDS